MSAYAISEDGRGYPLHGRYRNGDAALRALPWLIGERIEVRVMGAVREPKEMTAKWMMANCRELTVYRERRHDAKICAQVLDRRRPRRNRVP